jgi:predicted heme/steroid binding protein
VDQFELRDRIYSYTKEISHYSQLQVFATSYYQKNYFQMLIDEAVNSLMELSMDHGRLKYQENQADQQLPGQTERSFTASELTAYNGSEGKAAYVAVDGHVYDVSNLVGWAGGTHFGMYAGNDLSNVFMNCHQGMTEILKNVPQVGTLSA